MTALHFIFDGLPGPVMPRLIEVEDPDGKSVRAGEWRERADGTAELVVGERAPPTAIWQTIEHVVPFAVPEAGAINAAISAWAIAMETVPSYLQNRLNLHQLQSIPSVERGGTSGIAAARKALKAADDVTLRIGIRKTGETWAHVYSVMKLMPVNTVEPSV